jgi:glycosyltransferase involved in cell wall biosynthesis
MSDPLVSIIIPCYNAEKYIADAIQSALGQTYPNCEVIVIDDGSTDGSLEVIKAFAGSIAFETGPNRGGCAARNRGAELAEGTVFQFLDADDLLTPESVQCKVLAQSHAATNEIVCSSFHQDRSVFGMLGNCFKRARSVGVVEIIAWCAPQTSLPLIPACDFWRVGGFRLGLVCAQEYDLFLRISVLCDKVFVCNNHIGTIIRSTEGSISRAAGDKMHDTHLEILSDTVKLLSHKNDKNARIARQLVGSRCAKIARHQWRTGRMDVALKTITHARSISPLWHRGVYRNCFSSSFARLLGFELYEKTRAHIRTLIGKVI